ncbi:Transposase [Nostoc flagelliforme CCNUN1]|uniref:Transposase n=1 Tax=Nostoc flagelliforme CCNUN1 TaxID=2038116 RepID=A0A2K8SGI7_9NOSO|nr:Transposase [Nostoc flagelliforme CCNUN1]
MLMTRRRSPPKASQPLLTANLKLAENFCIYLEKHRHRIVNYQYYQAEQICSIGSGAIESTVKQIDRRTKISGAQWKIENVPQIIAHRCAYLNGLIFAP